MDTCRTDLFTAMIVSMLPILYVLNQYGIKFTSDKALDYCAKEGSFLMFVSYRKISSLTIFKKIWSDCFRTFCNWLLWDDCGKDINSRILSQQSSIVDWIKLSFIVFSFHNLLKDQSCQITWVYRLHYIDGCKPKPRMFFSHVQEMKKPVSFLRYLQ